MNNTNDTAMQRFLSAAGDVLNAAIEQAKADDAQGVASLAQAVHAGALVKVYATIGAAGAAWVGVQVIEPNGTTHDMAQTELQRRADA